MQEILGINLHQTIICITCFVNDTGLIEHIISFIIGFVASLSVAMTIIYWQFKHSMAGYRLRKIEEATHKIAEKKKLNTYTGMERNRYRYSLGVILDRLIGSYGTNDIPKLENLHPAMLAQDGDGWGTFNLYVRPVINDINAFSFISWLSFLPMLKKLGLIFKLCEQLENVTAEMDAIRLLQRTKKIKILEFVGENISITNSNDSDVQEQINQLLAELENLERCWKKWLTCINH
ncbi:MAG: hypothetical protein COA97_11750 [Flavobacteriales bacterium]|nr:MAG: hypothetical protein COA97_11750 [Flavobacteriales bacterium]